MIQLARKLWYSDYDYGFRLITKSGHRPGFPYKGLLGSERNGRG